MKQIISIIIGIAIVLFFAIGWGLNIVALWHLTHEVAPNYLMAAIRIVGIIVAPLGAILGWL